jgi:hypothetical protein
MFLFVKKMLKNIALTFFWPDRKLVTHNMAFGYKINPSLTSPVLGCLGFNSYRRTQAPA